MDGWTEVKRSGDMDFRVMLKSRRLYQALDDVWQSIPVSDRLVIGNRLVMVSDSSAFRYLLTVAIDDNLYGCTIPYSQETTFIFLNASKTRRKDTAFLRYLVAHELAHVFHNHRGERNTKRCEAAAEAAAARWGYTVGLQAAG